MRSLHILAFWAWILTFSAVVSTTHSVPGAGAGSRVITPVTPSTPLSASSIPCYGTVTVRLGQLLGIRTRASLAAAVVGGLENGEVIIIQSRVQGSEVNGNEIWYYIGIGYVPGAFIVLRTPGHPFWCLNYKW